MFDESVVTGGYLIRPRTKNGRFLPHSPKIVVL